MDQSHSLTYILFGEKRSASFLKNNPNHQDNLFIVCVAIFLWSLAILHWKRKLNAIYILICVVNVIYLLQLLILSGSQGAWGALICGALFLLPILIYKRNYYVVFVSLLILGGLFAYNYSLIGKGMYASTNQLVESDVFERGINESTVCSGDRIELTREDDKTDSGTSWRLILIQNGIELIKRKPLLGYGTYDRVELAKNDFIDKCTIKTFSHLHNFYLDSLVRGGAFYLSMLLLCCLSIWFILSKQLLSRQKYAIISAPLVFYIIYLGAESMVDQSFVGSRFLRSSLTLMAGIIGVTLSFQSLEKQSDS